MNHPTPRCIILPLPARQTAFLVDGVEKTRWYFGEDAPRPFFYPLRGPSGQSLTRMGHPGAPNHDHHRSVWFAHHKVLGIDFWSDNTAARIRQQQWLAYEDGPREAVMAVRLGWYDGHNPRELMQQELTAAVRPLADGEWELEVQARFTPAAESLEIGQSNFGFFAIRVAKNLSEYFGGGTLTGSSGATGEPANFGKPAKWMDYSGPVTNPRTRQTVTEGITCFDHPANPGHPLSWHVRADGWMGPSLTRRGSLVIRRNKPLLLRHLLHIHAGPVKAAAAERRFTDFARRPGFLVEKSRRPHYHYAVRRAESG